MISYYELLSMIKNNNIPKEIILSLKCGEMHYYADFDADGFNCYTLNSLELDNGSFKYYLADTLLESEMFDKNIIIVKELDHIKWNNKSLYNGKTTRKLDEMLMSRTEQLKTGINDIIRYLNKSNKEGENND